MIAVIAAVYPNRASDAWEESINSAARAAEVACHTNNIARHKSRHEIYKGLQKFQTTLLGRGYSFPDAVLWKSTIIES